MFNKKYKVLVLEVFLIVLGVIGLTLGINYITNVNIGTSSLAIDDINANVTNGTLIPLEDSSINVNTTSNVLRITFDVKGASTNTKNNIIYDVVLNLIADCTLKNENIKWNLYKNSILLTTGNISPSFDEDVLNDKLVLTETQEDLPAYSSTSDKYVFILWMSESCTEEDITLCDLSKALSSDMSNKSIYGNIDIRLNTGKKKPHTRVSSASNASCTLLRGNAASAVALANDGSDGKSGSGVYKIHHDAIPASESATGSEIPAMDDYRYYGTNPNNYVLLPDMNENEEYSYNGNGCSYNGEFIRKRANCETIYKIITSEDEYFYIDEVVEPDIVAGPGSMNWNDGKCSYNGSEISSDYNDTITEDICNKLSVVNNNAKYSSILLEKMGSPDTSKNGLYRIVGSIYNEVAGINELKVIKDFPLTDGTNSSFSWNLTMPEDNSQYYKPIWAPITDTLKNFSNATEINGNTSGSTLMQMLNSENKSVGYWWNRSSGTIYYREGNEYKTVNVNFDKYGLSESAKELIDVGRYYLGVSHPDAPAYYQYKLVRGTRKYSDESPLYWDGKIGLPYLEDAAYACGHFTEDDNYNFCPSSVHNSYWMSFSDGYWGLTILNPEIVGSSSVALVGFEDPGGYGTTFGLYPVKPTFYLKSDVIITSGDGSKDNPYRLSLD